jgi:hypothetical protein
MKVATNDQYILARRVPVTYKLFGAYSGRQMLPGIGARRVLRLLRRSLKHQGEFESALEILERLGSLNQTFEFISMLNPTLI